jgi:hypothetical protein
MKIFLLKKTTPDAVSSTANHITTKRSCCKKIIAKQERSGARRDAGFIQGYGSRATRVLVRAGGFPQESLYIIQAEPVIAPLADPVRLYGSRFAPEPYRVGVNV